MCAGMCVFEPLVGFPQGPPAQTRPIACRGEERRVTEGQSTATHTAIHTHTHTHTHTHSHAQPITYTHTAIHTHTHSHMHTHKHTHSQDRKSTRLNYSH